MLTRLDIIKRAQAMIGDEPIRAETDPGADTHIAIYDTVTDDLLSRYPWSFATVTRRLTRLAAVPVAHWPYFYQLPSDMIGSPRAVYNTEAFRIPFTRYEITENRLATDAEQIWMRFTKRAAQSLWPGYFVTLHQTVLMSWFCLSIREDQAAFDRLQMQAFGSPSMMGQGGMMGQATSLDAQAQPSPTVAEGYSPLVAARY